MRSFTASSLQITAVLVSAVTQNQPLKVEIKGFKTSHFLEPKTVPQDRAERDQWGMSNVLKVSLQTTIYSLHGRGWSRRRIARELGINREIVGWYLLLAKRLAGMTFAATGHLSPVVGAI